MEDKNPLVTTAQDTVLGAASGGALGGLGSNVEKFVTYEYQITNDKVNDNKF